MFFNKFARQFSRGKSAISNFPLAEIPLGGIIRCSFWCTGQNESPKVINEEYMDNHRRSRVKRNRKSGFRARMRTSKGRLTLSNKRRAGRSTNVKSALA